MIDVPKEIKEEWQIISSGTVEIIPPEGLLQRLLEAKQTGEGLKVKYGADPSAPDIHLGHTVVLRKLKQFQELGHKVIFLIGDFTARIGDPSDRSETRKRLSAEEVEQNARTYLDQIFKILDKDKTEVVFNSRWLERLNFSEIVEITSKYTVARMLEREDFKNRFRQERPIFIHEFLYPLMQGYDSVVLEADIEVGGTDQKFNCLVARELQKEFGQRPQIIVTVPLLMGTDGINKMSKSLGNYIGISEPAEEIYGKVMSISDQLMGDYFVLTLSYPEETVNDWMENIKRGKLHPRDLKARLAREIVTEYWGKEAALRAEEEFERIFRRRQSPSQLSQIEVKTEAGKIWVVKLLVSSGMVRSNREARKLIAGGGVYIDNQRVEKENLELGPGDYLIKVGKRKFSRIKVI